MIFTRGELFCDEGYDLGLLQKEVDDIGKDLKYLHNMEMNKWSCVHPNNKGVQFVEVKYRGVQESVVGSAQVKEKKKNGVVIYQVYG